MQLSVVQKLEIWLLNKVINVIWFVDIVTGYPINRSFAFASKPYVFVSMILIGVLTYFIYVPFIKTVIYPQEHSLTGTEPLVSKEFPVVLGADAPAKIRPVKISEAAFPALNSKAILVMDVNSGETIYAQNPKNTYASASTTKLMTAIIALDVYSLDDVLTMSKECSEVESTTAGLPLGEKFTVGELLKSMLVYSAGDAACLLGTGKIDGNEFLYLMNEKAFDLKMQNTFFTNTIGLDGLNGAQFSSPTDLYILARAAMERPLLKEIVAQQSVEVVSAYGDFKVILENTNRLLKQIPNSVGIKTGTTQEAGEVFIYEYSKAEKDIIIIVMGSTDRFGDTEKALYWVLENYSWETDKT